VGKIGIENFYDPLQRQTFCASPLIKVETFLTPPVWIEILTAIKQVCVAGKIRY
jgi:hypothetical protein